MHAIDTVLTPPLSMADTALAAGLTSALAAATKVNLDWWTDPGATYFMPSNEAFRSVGSVINSASDDALRDILEYHYLNDTETPLFTTEMSNTNYTTALGKNVQISYTKGTGLNVNNAGFLQHNIIVKNGVMHVIDQ